MGEQSRRGYRQDDVYQPRTEEFFLGVAVGHHIGTSKWLHANERECVTKQGIGVGGDAQQPDNCSAYQFADEAYGAIDMGRR